MNLEDIRAFVVICGNDGTGKSSVTNLINKSLYFSQGLFAFERSTKPDSPELLSAKTLISPKMVDEITFIYQFENRPELTQQIEFRGRMLRVYWIMLDAEIETIEKRINNRLQMTIYETHKCLVYYQKVYRQIALNYGIPLVATDTNGINKVVEIIEGLISFQYKYINNLQLNRLNVQYIVSNSLEQAIFTYLDSNYSNQQTLPNDLFQQLHRNGLFGLEIDQKLSNDKALRLRIFARWIASGTLTILNDSQFVIQKGDIKLNLPYNQYLFVLKTEGESKKIYKIVSRKNYFDKYVLILLKSTIFSHTNQLTGEISNLSGIRAKANLLLTDLFARNEIKHTYQATNKQGIILSEDIETTPIEIVFKKELVGTDKNNYYQFDKYEGVNKLNDYANGVYVRFDWRNPNHMVINSGLAATDNLFYYSIESYIGKQQFFKQYLANNKLIKPLGDKCIYPQIIENIVDVRRLRQLAIKVYCTLQYYFNKIGLELIDGCILADSKGESVWSEINPDCMRIKSIAEHEHYGKDIWRNGGLSSKDKIVQRWNVFNDLLAEYLLKNKFHLTQLLDHNVCPFQMFAQKMLLQNAQLNYKPIYVSFIKPKVKRRIILTIDLNNQTPTLVKSSQVYQPHSNGEVLEAYTKIKFIDEILMVDLNGAFKQVQQSQANRQVIKNICKMRGGLYMGGGLHTIESVNEMLQSGISKVVISSNTSKQFMALIPKDKLIVQLSVNEQLQVLIDGRKTNTKVHVLKKVIELISEGIKTISITFVGSEGHLSGVPRDLMLKLIHTIPRQITTIIIAGGISSLQDLRFLYTFDRVVPQLGSAIWKSKIKLQDIYNELINYDDHGLCPSVVLTKNGVIKGTVYQNQQSIAKCIQTGLLHRYSREHKQVMVKGGTSNNYQKVDKISLDCNGNSLVIVVDDKQVFCHNQTLSCYPYLFQSTLSSISDHIKQKKDSQSYSGKMQRHPQLALSKVYQQMWELFVAKSPEQQTYECSDIIAHLLMYLNGNQIDLNSVIGQLRSRQHKSGASKLRNTTGPISIGILWEKYYEALDDFVLNHLGIKIKRYSNRKLLIQHVIVDQAKYKNLFGDSLVTFLPVKSKDIPWLLALGTIQYSVTYSSTVDNSPETSTRVIEVPTKDIRLALIKRKGQQVDESKWQQSSKLVIACEHVSYIHDFLTFNLKLSPKAYTLDRINGLSESFIINKCHRNYELCDAIVQTGKTLLENDLEIWKIVKDYGDIKIGLYKRM